MDEGHIGAFGLTWSSQAHEFLFWFAIVSFLLFCLYEANKRGGDYVFAFLLIVILPMAVGFCST